MKKREYTIGDVMERIGKLDRELRAYTDHQTRMLAEIFAKALDDMFGQVNKRIDTLEKRMEGGFHQVNQRLDTVEKRLDGVDQRLEKIAFAIAGKNVVDRVRGLEKQMKIVSGKLGLAM